MPGSAPRGTPIGRALLVATSTTVATVIVIRLFWAAGAGSLTAVLETGPDAPADLLVLLVCALGVTVAGWLGTTALITALAALPGALGRVAGHLADRLAPVAVRRGVALALGSALVAGIPAVAHADSPGPAPAAVSVAPAPAPDPSFAVTGPAPAVDRGIAATPGATATSAPSTSVPDPGFTVTTETVDPHSAPRPAPSLGPLGPAARPTTPAPANASSPAPPTSPADASTPVRVVRGDSLWRIAARHLGPGATVAQIAREWPRWYAANRAVIGANPHLIHIGQELTPPSAPSERTGS